MLQQPAPQQPAFQQPALQQPDQRQEVVVNVPMVLDLSKPPPHVQGTIDEVYQRWLQRGKEKFPNLQTDLQQSTQCGRFIRGRGSADLFGIQSASGSSGKSTSQPQVSDTPTTEASVQTRKSFR